MFNRHWTATPGILCQGLKEWTRASCTGVASPKIFWGKMFDFMRITLFCLENRLSKHKMTIISKNLRGHGPFRPPPGYDCGFMNRNVFLQNHQSWKDLVLMFQLLPVTRNPLKYWRFRKGFESQRTAMTPPSGQQWFEQVLRIPSFERPGLQLGEGANRADSPKIFKIISKLPKT